MGGVIGLDYASAAVVLKSSGFWDDDQDCIPVELMRGLQIVEGELVRFKLCPECVDETRKVKLCSKCGRDFSDADTARPKGRGLLEG